jgi:hypothetical protein
VPNSNSPALPQVAQSWYLEGQLFLRKFHPKRMRRRPHSAASRAILSPSSPILPQGDDP